MEILPERVDTQTKAQGKKKSLHSSKPKESFSTEILPKRVDTWATSLKQSEMIESMMTKNQFHTEKFVIKGLKLKDSPWYRKDNLIHWKTLLYIPPNPQLQEQIIQQNHNHLLTGHLGIRRTLDLIKTRYYWPTIKQDIARYIKDCDKCQRVKVNTSEKKTPLNPNTVPDAPWEIISVDLIGPLPESKGKNAIMVIIDWFSKMIQLFPILTKITSQGMAKIFRDEIFKLHDIPKKVISDWGPQFISSFMKELYSQLQIEGNPSTTYHPETNGQTERINAWVEQYLCIYINHWQSNWIKWLSIVKFAHNQTSSSATTFSPFLLNYRQQPQSGFTQKGKERNPVANKFVEEMKSTQQIAKSALKMASYDMKWFYDQKVQPSVKYKPGDLVLLKATNIKIKWPSKKLNDKWYSWFKVLKKEGLTSYHLKLDKSWCQIHPVFHECLLHPYHQGNFPSQKQAPPPPLEIISGVKKAEMEYIINSKHVRNTIHYLIHWKGFPREENEWIPIKELANAQTVIRDFHCSNPNAPRLTIKI